MEFICPARYLGRGFCNTNGKFPSPTGRDPTVQSLELWLRSLPMLDIAYIAIGAVFLGVCVLYALACDHL
jgi:hypothetical protein